MSIDNRVKLHRIDSIEIVRFIASLLVALYHVEISLPNNSNSIFSIFENGGFGVDLFFVISGFIMVYTTYGRKFNLIAFLENRIMRIYPPYWLVLTATIFIALVLQAVGLQNQTYSMISYYSLIVSVFLIPIGFHIMPVAWTLAIEIVFYFLYGVSYRLAGLKGISLAIIIWYVFSWIFKVGVSTLLPSFWILFHSIVIEFLYGILIAKIYIDGKLIHREFVLSLGILLTILVLFFESSLQFIDLPREVQSGIPAAMIIYGIVGIKMTFPPIIILAGESSYMLYLIHTLLFGIIARASRIVFDIQIYMSDIFIIFMVLFTVAAAMLLTQFVERPYQKWRRSVKASSLA